MPQRVNLSPDCPDLIEHCAQHALDSALHANKVGFTFDDDEMYGDRRHLLIRDFATTLKEKVTWHRAVVRSR
jgi:hypothetical protein